MIAGIITPHVKSTRHPQRVPQSLAGSGVIAVSPSTRHSPGGYRSTHRRARTDLPAGRQREMGRSEVSAEHRTEPRRLRAGDDR
jgi:hypothetical protein